MLGGGIGTLRRHFVTNKTGQSMYSSVKARWERVFDGEEPAIGETQRDRREGRRGLGGI